MVDHGLGQHIDHLVAVDPPPDMDRQALPRVLVDQVQEPHCPSIVGVGTHEVVGPDVIAMLRPQPRAGAVVEPQTSAWFLPLRHLQSFAMPFALHAILAPFHPISCSLLVMRRYPYRPYWLASAMMARVSASSSSRSAD